MFSALLSLSIAHADAPVSPRELFGTAITNLEGVLTTMEQSDGQFLANYRRAREYAFQLEFLSNFLAKSDNKHAFASVFEIAKSLEDRLGRFNETDEMIPYCKTRGILQPNGAPAEQFFIAKRQVELQKFQNWLVAKGWFKDQNRLRKIESMLHHVKWSEGREFRSFLIKRLNELLADLQDAIDRGDYHPSGKRGYDLDEVEDKVHELRRDIRAISMYMSFLKGHFGLTDSVDQLDRRTAQIVHHYARLLRTPIAKSPYASLPETAHQDSILIPRPLFVAIASHVSQLGIAKDWAQNQVRLQEAGIQITPDLNHLSAELVDPFGRSDSFNRLVQNVLDEIKETQMFLVLVKVNKAQE